MANLVVILGHPDTSEARLNRALAHHYADAALAAGTKVRTIDVAALNFPILRSAEDFVSAAPPADIAAAQADIAWADCLAFFYPLWIGDMPALLKAFVEQTFRPGFALDYGGTGRAPKKLLHGKSARIVLTMGMPAFVYRFLLGAHSLKAVVADLRMCGIGPVRTTIFGNVAATPQCARRGWFRSVARAAQCDARPVKRAGRRVTSAVAAGVALTATAYGVYAARAWSRFGRKTGADVLLDDVMPDYDVALDHDVRVEAPPPVVFETMCRLNLEGSLIVTALFRARAALMRGRQNGTGEARDLVTQLQHLGWRIVAEDPGRELVFAAVTQPWQANPVFRGVSRDEFVRFGEPGYAKIAFSLRVDAAAPAQAVARTQTRVQTTDPRSRARFRRYWALLSPGIEIVRMVLLQRLKSEAESSWKPEVIQTFFTPRD